MRISNIGANSYAPDLAQGYAVHLVQGTARVAASIIMPKAVVNAHVVRQVNSNSEAQALKEYLVEQARSYEQWVESGKITKVIVIDVDRHARVGLETKRHKTPADAGGAYALATRENRFRVVGL